MLVAVLVKHDTLKCESQVQSSLLFKVILSLQKPNKGKTPFALIPTQYILSTVAYIKSVINTHLSFL